MPDVDAAADDLVPTLMAFWWIGNQLEHGVYYPPEIAVKARQAIASINQMFARAVTKGVVIGLGEWAHRVSERRRERKRHLRTY